MKYWVGKPTNLEKDLGFMITADGKNKAQVEAAVNVESVIKVKLNKVR
jgi:hypothetical protein